MQSFRYTPYIIPLALAALISAGLAVHIWNRRSLPGAKPAVALMAAIFVWSACFMYQFMGVELETKLFWARMQYFGIASLPLALFAFALAFTGRDGWLTRARFSALAAIPLLTVLLVLSNDSHRLFWSDWSLESAGGDSAFLRLAHGPAFWLNAIFAYALVAASTWLTVQALRRRPREYRGQILSTLLGIAIPWLTNLVSNLVYQVDLTPFAFLVSVLAIAWSIYRYHLFENEIGRAHV